jgi:lactate dehydrogenase-like 2-hydroxyacid dehydrogenase
MIDLTGKGGLIVGVKRIGRTVAMRLAQEGVNLAIAHRNSRAEAEYLQAQIASLADRADFGRHLAGPGLEG